MYAIRSYYEHDAAALAARLGEAGEVDAGEGGIDPRQFAGRNNFV